MLVVASARDGRRRNGLLDARHVRWRERHAERAQRLRQAAPASARRSPARCRALRQHPCDRELRGGDALLGRQLLQRLDEPLVALAVLAGEARQVRTKVACDASASSH